MLVVLNNSSPNSSRASLGARLTLYRVFGKRAARLLDRVRSFGGVDVAVRVHRHALARRALIHAVLAVERRDVPRNAVFADRTDADAVAPVRMGERTRLRVDHVHRVALDEDAARTAERVARLEVLPVLIEDLDAVIAAVGH